MNILRVRIIHPIKFYNLLENRVFHCCINLYLLNMTKEKKRYTVKLCIEGLGVLFIIIIYLYAQVTLISFPHCS